MHLDTCILYSLYDERDNLDLTRATKRLLNKHDRVKYKISLTAIGEAINSVSGNPELCTLCAKIVSQYVRAGKLEIIGHGRYGSRQVVVKRAYDLMDIDEKLLPVDALILATAIEDDDCSILYTTDSVLLQSNSLQRAASERGLRVIEPPGLD